MTTLNTTVGTYAEQFAYNLQKRAHDLKQDLTIMSDSCKISKEHFEFLLNSATFKIDKSPLLKEDQIYECFYKEFNFYYLLFNKKLNSYYIDFFAGFEEGKKDLLDKITPVVDKVDSFVTWAIGIDNHGDLITKNIKIDAPGPIYPSFYPQLTTDIANLIQEYLASTASILLLIGKPGTGKTNFIRKVILDTNSDVLLTYNDDLAQRSDVLFTHFYDSKERFLIVEDADTYISARTEGNAAMKKLLNITDGLTSNKNKKVIFSTNLPNLASIDPALLREGRCFGVLHFDPHTKEEAKLVAKDLGFDEALLTKNTYTLAELFALKNPITSFHKEEKSYGGMGFVRQ